MAHRSFELFSVDPLLGKEKIQAGALVAESITRPVVFRGAAHWVFNTTAYQKLSLSGSWLHHR